MHRHHYRPHRYGRRPSLLPLFGMIFLVMVFVSSGFGWMLFWLFVIPMFFFKTSGRCFPRHHFDYGGHEEYEKSKRKNDDAYHEYEEKPKRGDDDIFYV